MIWHTLACRKSSPVSWQRFFLRRSLWAAEQKAIEARFARRCQRRATGHSHGTGECQRPHSHSSSILPVVADFLEIGGKPGPPRKHLMSSTPIPVTKATRLGIGFVRNYSFLYRSFLPGYHLRTPIRECFHIP